MHSVSNLDLPYAPTFRDIHPVGPQEWKRSLDDIVMPGDLLFPDTDEAGQVRACRLTGGGVLATVRLGHQEVRHDARHAAAFPDDDVIVLVALSGSGSISQKGKTLNFRAGDITYRRARLPSHARLEETTTLVMIRLPLTRFFGHAISRHASFEPHCADAQSAPVRLIHHFIDTVLPEFPHMSADAVTAAEQAFVSLLCAAYLNAADQHARTSARVPASCNALRWSHLSAYLMANIRDPELDVTACATALGVSRRYIHRMFESTGTPYRTFVLQHRLECCRSDLLNPMCAALSIEQIGWRNGFKDAAHFSRRFHTRYGLSPREFRKLGGVRSAVQAAESART
ncbi:helix-turn-helix domain-containing protein [Paraburkholderia fungorum]|uniref:HTH araC/xylS-type domain-containing protein n=1 Tax=Paraburkholderia fungorum TaxID=134537 RepID=A0A3R7E970_9BURK|nr:helix-turn-helix domain-containing protein [Paraburkholderia fungorum]RKF48571.1 hypothetical protein BCY88_20555 [Paraburkholderia fungorum]